MDEYIQKSLPLPSWHQHVKQTEESLVSGRSLFVIVGIRVFGTSPQHWAIDHQVLFNQWSSNSELMPFLV